VGIGSAAVIAQRLHSCNPDGKLGETFPPRPAEAARRDQLRRDVERLNALVLDGFVPLQFTTAQLIEERGMIFTTIRAALSSASAP